MEPEIRSLLERMLPILEEHDCGWDCESQDEYSNTCPVPNLIRDIRAALNLEPKPHERVWTGPGELERSGYIDPTPKA